MDHDSKISLSEFYSSFLISKKEIEQLIINLDSRPESKTNCLNRINQLSLLCRRAVKLLPVHDQKIYSDDIQSLYDKLSAKSQATKSKFKFKGSKRLGAKEVPDIKQNEMIKPGPSSPSPSELLHGLNNSLYIDNQLTGNIKISTIADSVVVLQTTASTADIQHVNNSIILIQYVQGPIYVTDVHNSVLIVACHQFRIHQSSHVDIYLSCSSKRPIIESSTSMRFAQYPVALCSSLSPSFEPSQWEDVDDFNWLRKEPSPNWSVLDDKNIADIFLKQNSEKLRADWRNLLNK